MRRRGSRKVERGTVSSKARTQHHRIIGKNSKLAKLITISIGVCLVCAVAVPICERWGVISLSESCV